MIDCDGKLIFYYEKRTKIQIILTKVSFDTMIRTETNMNIVEKEHKRTHTDRFKQSVLVNKKHYK